MTEQRRAAQRDSVHPLLLRARLPDSMRDWVRNDLAGKGATGRMMRRVAVPAVLVLAPFWLIPTTLDVHLSMTLPILIPFVYFSHALNKVWRRHMLQVHGLDPNLVDERRSKRDAHMHQAYIERYGPGTSRPATATTSERLRPARVARRVRRTPAPSRPDDRWHRPARRGSAAATSTSAAPRPPFADDTNCAAAVTISLY